MSTDQIVGIKALNKWYGDFHVLRDVDLNVAKGERIVICGPSGSGKSTLIRCINRLEEHQQGTLKVDGVELTDDVKAIEAIRKEVGMVFQQFNLFPHLTVLQNLTHGQVREQVELLEHHPDLFPDRLDRLHVVGELDAVDLERALLMLLEPVDAADERRFAGAGRPADDDPLALGDIEVDVAQHV